MKTNSIRILLLSCAIALSVLNAHAQGAETRPRIDRIFFAQHHVLEPTNQYFKLIGSLEALIKVQVYSDSPMPAPYVFAILELNGNIREIRLLGPKQLDKKPDVDPVLMEHSYDDSFTAVIPGEWIKTGLKASVEIRDYNYNDVGNDDADYGESSPGKYINVLDQKDLGAINVGAPTKLVMQFFDIHYFGRGKGADFPEGWETEMKARLPVADLTIHRAKGIMFDEIVMQPMQEKPSTKYKSVEEFRQKMGIDFDGEQGIALQWCRALKEAGGTFAFWRPYEVTIGGVHSGGQAGGYRSCANLHRHGVILHELGHTFGLPHWATNRDYPYKRTMYGKDRGEETIPNAGPTWAFDINRREFLAPYTIVEGKRDWKRDPMHGGAWSREKDYLYRHFSDYSMMRIKKRLEDQAVYWNEELGQYAQWNQETAAYDKVVENDGVKLPIERDVDVISLLATANLVVPDSNIIYPPIGPYTGGLIRLFDAEVETDRKAAESLGYGGDKCSVALRVTQGGNTKTYLLKAKVSPDDDPLKAFTAAAINLPARGGQVTKAELLYCQDLISKGITEDAKVLYSWAAKK